MEKGGQQGIARALKVAEDTFIEELKKISK